MFLVFSSRTAVHGINRSRSGSDGSKVNPALINKLTLFYLELVNIAFEVERQKLALVEHRTVTKSKQQGDENENAEAAHSDIV